jgi:hypothetical protein
MTWLAINYIGRLWREHFETRHLMDCESYSLSYLALSYEIVADIEIPSVMIPACRLITHRLREPSRPTSI